MQKNNPKLKKIVVAVITIFCVLYALIFIACKIFLKPTDIKAILVTKLESALDRKVSLSDDLSIGVSWDLSPYVRLNDITIGNASWGQQKDMLSIEKLDLQLSLMPLIFKKVNISSLTLRNPTIHLETSGSRNNWDFGAKPATTTPAAADSSSVAVDVNDINITNGSLSYKDNGKAARTIKIDKLKIANSDTHLKIKDMQILIGGSDLSGHLDIGKKDLSVEGTLESSLISLSDLSGSSSSSSGGNGEYVIPSDELPIQKLKDADIDVVIGIKKLVLDKVVLTSVTLKAKNDNQVLRIALDPPANLFNAKLHFNADYDLKPKTPTLKLSFSTKSLKLDNFVPVSGSSMDLNSNLTSVGSNLNALVGNLNGKILATATPGEYINSGSGFTNILSTILSSSITFEKSKSNTDFQCAVVNLKVNNGVANTNKGIALQAATVNVVGSGSIDFRNGRLNLSINPQNTGSSSMNVPGLSMAQLVNVSGNISKPVINLNPIGLIAGSALGKGLLGSIAGGLPGGLASIMGGAAEKKAEPEAPAVSEVCKNALAM